MFRQLTAAALMLGAFMPVAAQSDGGLLMGFEVEKKISKSFSIDVEADLRTRNDFRTMDRWGAGVNATYKFTTWIKGDVGYNLYNYNFHEDISYKASGAYNHWRPSYWGIKHRLHASLTGTMKTGSNIKLVLRERWQYTYRPEKTVQRWDFDEEQWEDKVRSGKAKHQLRSRLQVEYDKKRALLTPFASVELFNAWSVEKVRYTVGTDFRLAKRNALSVYYRFQDIRVNDDDGDPDTHYLGIAYKLKF